jgi:hypothetical protein
MGMDWVLGVDNYWPQPLMATGLPWPSLILRILTNLRGYRFAKFIGV